jgi:transcriptional regulator with XRE-family HTH domain
MFVTPQALFVATSEDFETCPYAAGMAKAASASVKRSPLGARIAEARKAAAPSQAQLAAQIGVSQQMVGYLEVAPVAIRPELLTKLSNALHLRVEELLGQPAPKLRASGPAGRARRVFDAVTKLPRRQQDKIIDTIETLLAGHHAKSGA